MIPALLAWAQMVAAFVLNAGPVPAAAQISPDGRITRRVEDHHVRTELGQSGSEQQQSQPGFGWRIDAGPYEPKRLPGSDQPGHSGFGRYISLEIRLADHGFAPGAEWPLRAADQLVAGDNKVVQSQASGQVQPRSVRRRDREALVPDDLPRLKSQPVAHDSPPAGNGKCRIPCQVDLPFVCNPLWKDESMEQSGCPVTDHRVGDQFNIGTAQL